MGAFVAGREEGPQPSIIRSMQKEFAVTLKDLRFISIRCQHCDTRVVLDLAHEDFNVGGKSFFCPTSCPGCRIPFDSSIPENVNNLHRVYRAIPEGVRDAITFRAEPDAA